MFTGSDRKSGEPPALSVVICTRNRPEKLTRAVASVLANSFADFELIVVDQSTDRRSADAMMSFDDDRIRYYPTATVGVSISRNFAVHLARADTVSFIDDDCVCDREWLATIRSEFAAEPSALGVYGRVIPYGKASDSNLVDVAVSDGMICPALNQSAERRVIETTALPHLTLGGGNNMSFRKEAFWQVGLFIESLGPGSAVGTGEDTEFSYRLLWHGCRLIYCPAAVVQHDNWLDRTQFAEMMKVAVRAKAAIFSSYALRWDPLAFSHLLDTAWQLARDRLAIGSSLVGLAYFVSGLSKGPKYRFMQPPRLEFSAIWRVRSMLAEQNLTPARRGLASRKPPIAPAPRLSGAGASKGPDTIHDRAT
jgi:glycosyltransferase involved in cell wall biosynthesis